MKTPLGLVVLPTSELRSLTVVLAVLIASSLFPPAFANEADLVIKYDRLEENKRIARAFL